MIHTVCVSLTTKQQNDVYTLPIVHYLHQTVNIEQAPCDPTKIK